MADVTLTTVTRAQGANRALQDGTVRPQRFALRFEEVSPLIDAFRRMVRDVEFDVCEMSFATYLCARANGRPFTALPVFLVRRFHHGAIVHNRTAGIDHPRDLEGRRVGVHRGYTVTTGVWARGILADEHGVDLDEVTWVRFGDEHVAEYQPPGNVIDADTGADLAQMVASGELAAAVGVQVDHPVVAEAAQRGDVAPLIPDPDAAGFAAFRRRGLYPINHLVVVRDDLLAAHPDLAVDVFVAFAEARDRYVERLRAHELDPMTADDRTYVRVVDATDQDPLPYGIEPNRAMIEQMVRHAVSQRIIDAPAVIEDLFAAGTHDLVA